LFVIPLRTKRNGSAPSPVARQVTAAAAVTVQTVDLHGSEPF
jgi:hypothetical protein